MTKVFSSTFRGEKSRTATLELPRVVIPPAPFLPESDAAALYLAWRTYQSIRRVFYRTAEALHPQMSSASELVVLQLRALEVRPAEWVLERFRAFSKADIPGLDQPPLRWVYAPKALQSLLDRGMHYHGELSVPRLHYPKEVLSLQHRRQECLRKREDLAWLGPELLRLQHHTRELQRWVDLRAACGEYIWGESF